MASELIAASQLAIGTVANTESQDRTTSINRLYLAHFAEVRSAIYEHRSETLVWDAEKIMIALSERLRDYQGPISDEGFLRWAKAFVRRESERFSITNKIITEQRRIIFGAINRYRWTSATDRAVTADDLFAEVTALVFRKAHELNLPGIAGTKMSTRITGLVKRHVQLYYNAPNARRRRLIEKQISQLGELGVETLSPEEIASMESDASPWDAGYSEAGLSVE
jgi:hypothetical protein